MKDKFIFIIMLIIININKIYNFPDSKSISLSNEIFLIKENRIYSYYSNILKLKEYFDKNQSQENLEYNNTQNIFYFKYFANKNIIFIFEKSYIYIFSNKAEYIKKCKLFLMNH